MCIRDSGIELRLVVEDHDDVGPALSLDRRRRPRLEVVEADGLHVDLEAEKALGFKINMETIGLNDLQPRATAAIQAQGGPDIIMIFDNKAQLYADSCADVSAVCEAIGSSQGGYYDLAKANTHDGTKWIAVPYC